MAQNKTRRYLFTRATCSARLFSVTANKQRFRAIGSPVTYIRSVSHVIVDSTQWTTIVIRSADRQCLEDRLVSGRPSTAQTVRVERVPYARVTDARRRDAATPTWPRDRKTTRNKTLLRRLPRMIDSDNDDDPMFIGRSDIFLTTPPRDGFASL